MPKVLHQLANINEDVEISTNKPQLIEAASQIALLEFTRIWHISFVAKSPQLDIMVYLNFGVWVQEWLGINVC